MDFALIIIYISVYIGLVSTVFYILGYKADKKKIKPLFSDAQLLKVSVIIPAWNEQAAIAKTIESAIASDYPKGKLEIIIVDDGSKDKTLEIAKKYRSKIVKVYTKKNGGKGTALNYGIKRSSGEIIFSMDADTFIEPHCVREMTRYFKDPQVMSVAPSMLIYKPKGFLQRVQHAEYLFGLFIRKAFTSVNSIYVTPGAFSAYRKSFMEKHGYYDEGNITEDLEMSLRIQFNHYKIQYSPESPVYTIAPNKFKALLVQRRRWYTGLMKNTWRYRRMISPKYGDMGLFVIPIAWLSIFFSVFATSYFAIKTFLDIKKELLFLSRINFDFGNWFSINWYVLERFLFNFFTKPVILFLIFFIVILGVYMWYATKKTGKANKLYFSVAAYFLLFAILFGFWWIVSIIYVLFNKKVKWR